MRLRFASFPFPFRTRFGHAAAARDVAENVVVLAQDDAGHVGLGEGCPREYVTGETSESALVAVARWKADAETLDGRAALEAWMAGHAADVDANPSAFAAIELALLDVFARRAGLSLEGLLGVDETIALPRVSAVYGIGSSAKFWYQLVRFQLYGMRDAKLKVSGDAARDRLRVRALARFGRVRVDANNSWRSAAQACEALATLGGAVWAAEEPLAARDFAGLAAVAAGTGVKIVLDESATHLADLDRVQPGPHYILNARVSKHGGLLRTLAMIRAARDRGFGVIVGAQVGETSVLARAALVAARAAGDALVGFEGAYGLRLLERDATTATIGFRSGGRVTTAAIGRIGSGLTPTDEVRDGCR